MSMRISCNCAAGHHKALAGTGKTHLAVELWPGRGRLAHWRLPVFAFLYRNAVKVVDRFRLPSSNVVEVARKIEV